MIICRDFIGAEEDGDGWIGMMMMLGLFVMKRCYRLPQVQSFLKECRSKERGHKSRCSRTNGFL